MKKLPIGIQTFSKLRKEDMLYVDKTKYVYDLVHGNSWYVFLGRPRRFGKSLFLSTLKSYFEGERELFQGLAIENLETEWKRHPVILISLASVKESTIECLDDNLDAQLAAYEQEYGITPTSRQLGVRFNNLVKAAHDKTGIGVVVLIDEYDGPLLNVVHDDATMDAIRNRLSGFYSGLKDMDPYLRFTFITGITKFSQVSIFSILNNVTNISMVDEYAAICGITQEEIKTQMAEGIEKVAAANLCDREKAIELLKNNYDGYHFSAKSPDIFNPYSLLRCFDFGIIEPYWFDSGTPTSLVRMARKYRALPSQFDDVELRAAVFDTPTEKITNIYPLLYQSGYLTIKDYDPVDKIYTLGIPNHEVRIGLMESLLANYLEDPQGADMVISKFMRTIAKGDLEEALELLQTFFETVPYCSHTNYEGHWQQMLYVVFSLCGALADVEVRTAKGRVDMAMTYRGFLYLFEIKINDTAASALNQINIKNYAKRFALLCLPIVKVGIAFDTATHTIKDWLIQIHHEG